MDAIKNIQNVRSQLRGVFPMNNAILRGKTLLSTAIRHSLSFADLVVALPEGMTILSVESFGTSAWTITGRLHVIEPNGTKKFLFAKVFGSSSLWRGPRS